jgi:hypothetical protein
LRRHRRILCLGKNDKETTMMETDYALYRLAREIHAKRLREAEEERLLLSAKKASGLSLGLRSLSAVLAYLRASIARLGGLRDRRGRFTIRGWVR